MLAIIHSRPLSLFSRQIDEAVLQEMTLDEWEALNPRAMKESAPKKPNKVSTAACPAQPCPSCTLFVLDMATLP